MKAAKGTVFKYGDNVDTDVIIPARYLNSSDPAELATHCMEDIDKTFIDQEFRLRLFKRACAHRHQSGGSKLCDCGNLRKNLLPQRH